MQPVITYKATDLPPLHQIPYSKGSVYGHDGLHGVSHEVLIRKNVIVDNSTSARRPSSSDI